jgi:hypothetical protein
MTTHFASRDTELAAAASMRPHTERLRDRVLALLRDHPDGLTDDEGGELLDQQELPAAAKQGRASEQRSSAALSSRRPAKGASLSAAGTASEKPAGAIAREMRPEPPGRRCSICGASPARPFMNAWLCSAHEPVVPIPDPARTTAALRERRSRMVSFVGLLARKAAVDG